MNIKLEKRIKSFIWRLGGILVVMSLGFIIEPEISNMIGVPEIMITIIGLVIGEITKELNRK